jgi:hypothetical protein
MFNLYQSQSLTKEMIIGKQLHRCQLRFWLSIRHNNDFIPISHSSFSLIIEESKFCYSFFSFT